MTCMPPSDNYHTVALSGVTHEVWRRKLGAGFLRLTHLILEVHQQVAHCVICVYYLYICDSRMTWAVCSPRTQGDIAHTSLRRDRNLCTEQLVVTAASRTGNVLLCKALCSGLILFRQLCYFQSVLQPVRVAAKLF
eukprot:SAG11_NODE_336_length_10544_cov_9.794926_10_plen_136_part_00